MSLGIGTAPSLGGERLCLNLGKLIVVSYSTQPISCCGKLSLAVVVGAKVINTRGDLFIDQVVYIGGII